MPVTGNAATEIVRLDLERNLLMSSDYFSERRLASGFKALMI